MNRKSAEYLQQCRAALNTEQTRSLAETDNWSHVDKHAVHNDWDVLYKKIVPMIGHSSASDPVVQAMVSEHYRIVSKFYTPSKQAYVGMGLFYGENSDMLKFHRSYHPDLVPFLAEAMLLYAEANL